MKSAKHRSRQVAAYTLACLLLISCRAGGAATPPAGASVTAETPAASAVTLAPHTPHGATATARITPRPAAGSPTARAATPAATPSQPPTPAATPAATPTPPPGLSGRYAHARLSFSLPLPDGWIVNESGNRAALIDPQGPVGRPDFGRAPGAIVNVLKRELALAAFGRPLLSPVEWLAYGLSVELPNAPDPEPRPRVVAGRRAAEAFLGWTYRPTGEPVAAYALAVEDGPRALVFIAGAPAREWPAWRARFVAMAAGLVLADPAEQEGVSAGLLLAGDRVDARLGASPQEYRFDGLAGDYATIVLAAGSGDPAVALFDPQDRQLAADDDAGVGLGAVLSDVPLDLPGSYRIVVWDAGGRGGEYSLQFGSSATPLGGGPLFAGDTPVGSLGYIGAAHRWTVSGEPGTTVAFSVTRQSGDLVPWLELLDPAGRPVAAVAGAPERALTRLGPFPLGPEAGRYALRVQAIQGSGEYRIELGFTPRARGWTGRAEPNEPVQATLPPGGYQAWQLAAGGEPLQLQVVTEAGELIASDVFDTGGRLLAWLRSDLGWLVAVPAGERELRAVVHAEAEADYALVYGPGELEEPAAVARELVFDAPGDGTLVSGAEERWTFAGAAGQVVRLALDGDDGLGGYLLLDAPGGGRLALQLTADGDVLLAERPLVAGGPYTVTVGAYRGGGPYALLVSDISADASGGGRLGYGDIAFGELSPGVEHAWTLQGAPGDTLAVRVNRGVGDLLPSIAVWSPSGRLLATAVADRDGVAVLEPLALGEAGVYTIVIGEDEGTSGDYQITIR